MGIDLKTPLYNNHIAYGANMISFSGYTLPIYYSSINREHNIVRSKAGLFDVCHMSEFIISGNDSEKFLQNLTVNDVSALKTGQIQYTVMCYNDGGIVDDFLLYKREKDFMIVANAANRKKNKKWLINNSKGDVHILDKSDKVSLIAIQGPKSRDILQALTKSNLDTLEYYSFCDTKISGFNTMVSRTGYTGELGYEIYSNNEEINKIWDCIIEAGDEHGIEPVGLGCRDTLRLEMKYALYGNDINSKTNPIEAGLGWITKLSKKSFIGKNAIVKQKKNVEKLLVSIEMLERAIPRKGCLIYLNDKIIGKISSGTMSPSLGKGIALGYLDIPYAKPGNRIYIDIRGNLKKGVVVKPPFYKNGSLRD